jgi:hypothetical protein
MCFKQLAYAVGGKDHMLSLQKTGAQHVAKGVVFLVEGEDCGRGEA